MPDFAVCVLDTAIGDNLAGDEMIEKKYICDLCHATCASDTANGFLIGLYWEDFPSHGWVVVPSADANHHICKTCAESIKKIKIVEAKDER